MKALKTFTPNKLRTPFTAIAITMFIVLAFPTGLYFIVNLGSPISNNIHDFGSFGGLLAGSIGSGFLALTFFAALYGIIVQHYEFSALRQQIQEQNFVTAIKSHKETYIQTLTNINISKFSLLDKSAAIGLEAIRYNNEMCVDAVSGGNYCLRLYEQTRKNINCGLDHYLRIVFHYFKFLDAIYESSQQDLDNQEKYSLEIRLFQSRLSEPELTLMALNGLSIHGKRLMKPLIEKWGLLENLPENSVRRFPESILEKYHSSAFGKNADRVLQNNTP